MPSNVMKNLFLSGPIGSGKSTAIATALGADLTRAGGFLTVRQRDDTGRAVAYYIQYPDGRSKEMKMKAAVLKRFAEIFGDTEGAKVYFAPGRVNLIGEHTDYNGGHVFPCALTIGT